MFYQYKEEIFNVLKNLKEKNKTNISGYNKQYFDKLLKLFEQLINGHYGYVYIP
jgi:hypothetical protein